MGELNDMQWHGVDARRTNVEGISWKQVLISLSLPFFSCGYAEHEHADKQW